MGPLFPGWLQWHVSVAHLDLSSAGIADRLPDWFSDGFSNLNFLNMSNNNLNGSLPTNTSFMSLEVLLLGSNQLTGQIRTLPPNITILDLSNNSLSGLMFSSTGSANLLELSLFSNQISPVIFLNLFVNIRLCMRWTYPTIFWRENFRHASGKWNSWNLWL